MRFLSLFNGSVVTGFSIVSLGAIFGVAVAAALSIDSPFGHRGSTDGTTMPMNFAQNEEEFAIQQQEFLDCNERGIGNCICIGRISGHLLYASESTVVGEIQLMAPYSRRVLARQQAYKKC